MNTYLYSWEGMIRGQKPGHEQIAELPRGQGVFCAQNHYPPQQSGFVELKKKSRLGTCELLTSTA